MVYSLRAPRGGARLSYDGCHVDISTAIADVFAARGSTSRRQHCFDDDGWPAGVALCGFRLASPATCFLHYGCSK